ncbi:VOC family protein [Terrisporobacter petrolearius]|uniref:bleomycin resistance protein n=1 Tax=Terrisporobacter petrolearius TaxID=1460447 RepID=UPI001D16454B|nr:VOC family protein [Terrisporobacter petrolearius]MCC3866200.1 VOC family protein [Terrisporobacter petrolearius]
MRFNKLIPELTVFNIEETRDFYLNILGFKLEYHRIEDNFIFVSFENSQFMFEQLHDDGWNIGELEYPLGRGINLSVEVKDIDSLYDIVISHNVTPFRKIMISNYKVGDKIIEQKEFLLQDPNGYLLRFTD